MSCLGAMAPAGLPLSPALGAGAEILIHRFYDSTMSSVCAHLRKTPCSKRRVALTAEGPKRQQQGRADRRNCPLMCLHLVSLPIKLMKYVARRPALKGKHQWRRRSSTPTSPSEGSTSTSRK